MDASSPASSSSPGVTFPAMPISAAASTTAQSEGPRTFELVVAACEETKEGQGIGKDGRLPWSLKGDMAFFRKITSSTENSSRMNAVIMGRKTWESLPPRFQPLPNRINIVLSRNGAPTASTPASAEGVVPPTASSSSGPTNSPISGPTNSPASGPTNSPARGSTSSYIKSPISGSTNTRAGTLVSTNSASGPASSAPADAAASSSPAPAASSTRALFSDISNHTDEDSQQHKPSQLLKAQAQQQQQQQHEQQPLSQLTLPDQLQPEAPQPVQQQQQRQQQQQQVYWCNSLEAAMQLLQAPELAGRVERAFVIGGGEVYRAALETPMCAGVFLTSVKAAVQCDTFFPTLNAGAWRLRTASMPQSDAPKALPAAAVSTGHAAPAAAAAGNDFQYTFLHFVRNEESSPPASSSRHQEHQYLDLIRSVLENGVYRGDRTGTGTYSHFGATMRFDLRTSFPLLTTKRVFWRGVAEELLWFVSGDTSAKTLQDKKIKIWDGNSSREYLNKIGLVDREEGDLGPVYGFQWRHFGANYSDMHADYSGQGVDQLADIIRRLKSTETRNDRRLILSAWNPAALHLMALPPCHMMCQFYVANDELSCMMYQRSCDLGLGVPFNIASYALLTCLVAQVCGLKRGEFIHVLGDAHVYVNHAEPLLQQLQNEPRPFPVLHINPEKTDIDSFTMDDLTLEGYNPHASLAMKMAV